MIGLLSEKSTPSGGVDVIILWQEREHGSLNVGHHKFIF